MDCTPHFVKVAGESLSRLTALIEQAAALLDQRGSLRVRAAILKELHLSMRAGRSHSGQPGI